MQLPSTSPTAMSGYSPRTVAENPVNNSGRLVVAASRMLPTQVLPRPLSLPMASPWRARRAPPATMMPAVRRKNIQVMCDGSSR